jgi:ribosomal protein L37AE/L43A
VRLPRLQRLPCPLCGRALESAKIRHGLVWLCRTCRAGAATLPVLRQAAPRGFVNHLWQGALHDGRESGLVCPSCDRPFTRLTGPRANPRLEVCVRCFWVWLGPRALTALSRRPALPAPPAPEPRYALAALTADVLRREL